MVKNVAGWLKIADNVHLILDKDSPSHNVLSNKGPISLNIIIFGLIVAVQ